MADSWLRVRGALDRWLPVVVVALVVLAGVGAWVTYDAHVTAETTVERTVDEWRVTGEFDHRATVQSAAGASVEPGTTVENLSVYVQDTMPVLSGTFSLGYEGEAPADVRIRRLVRIQSVGDTTDGGQTVYWQRTQPVESGTVTLRPGGGARVPFSLNVTRATETARNASADAGSSGRLEVAVVIDVTVDRQTGAGAAQTTTFALRALPDGGLYRVDSDGRTERFERTETVTVERAPGPLRGVGGPLLALVGLGGAVGLVAGRRRGAIALSARERAWLDYRDDRAEFDDAIETVWLPSSADGLVQLPSAARGLPVVEADALADLVAFADDRDEVVLESPGERTYHVVHDGYRYTYEAPPEPGTEPSAQTDPDRAVGARSEPSIEPED
jgi:hypothetical protein